MSLKRPTSDPSTGVKSSRIVGPPSAAPIISEKVAILDAGAQYGKVIDRRVRELSVECELLPLYLLLEVAPPCQLLLVQHLVPGLPGLDGGDERVELIQGDLAVAVRVALGKNRACQPLVQAQLPQRKDQLAPVDAA